MKLSKKSKSITHNCWRIDSTKYVNLQRLLDQTKTNERTQIKGIQMKTSFCNGNSWSKFDAYYHDDSEQWTYELIDGHHRTSLIYEDNDDEILQDY